MKLLLAIVGDSPRLPTGLGRIARDLSRQIHQTCRALPDLDVELHVVQFGWEEDGNPISHPLPPYPFVRLTNASQDWGRAQVEATLAIEGARYDRVILFTIWDPARAFAYASDRDTAPWQTWWGYFAIDGHKHDGTIGGPALPALASCNRILAYTRYGARVIKASLKTNAPVQYLPHGIDPPRLVEASDWPYFFGTSAARADLILGCIAANQPRKDLRLFFATLQQLRQQDVKAYGWLHTDRAVTGAWALPELVEHYLGDFPHPRCTITTEDSRLTDEDLLVALRACQVTVAVGRGEGFGYPIIDSLSVGTPVVGYDYAGGAEFLVPADSRLSVDHYTWTADNAYLIERPWLSRTFDAVARVRVLAQRETERPWYAGSVAHLYWHNLWPRWQQWVREGVKAVLASHKAVEETTW